MIVTSAHLGARGDDFIGPPAHSFIFPVRLSDFTSLKRVDAVGVMTSGFTFLRVDAYYQEIVKGVIIVAAVIVDVYRQKKRTKH